jgi:acetyl/propionyl-CoA carboxylase alpha subunit
MVAKFIAHGRDRADAIRRLVRALDEVPLIGPVNNGRFLRDLLLHPQFRDAQLTTTRLDEWAAAGEPLLQRPAPPTPPGSWRPRCAPAPRPAARQRGTLRHSRCSARATRTLPAPPTGLQILSIDGRWRAIQQ